MLDNILSKIRKYLEEREERKSKERQELIKHLDEEYEALIKQLEAKNEENELLKKKRRLG